jgi:hypothetical protein
MIGTMTLTNEISGRMTGSVLLSSLWEDRPGSVVRQREAEIREVPVARIVCISPLEQERTTFQATRVTPCHWESDFVPRTALGRKLLDLRNRAIAAGIRLLTEDEVLEEVRRRRGEIEGDEKDLY